MSGFFLSAPAHSLAAALAAVKLKLSGASAPIIVTHDDDDAIVVVMPTHI